MKFNRSFMIIAFVVFCIIGFFIVYNEKNKKLNRTLDTVPFSEIQKLQQHEFSKIKGKVFTQEELTAPLSKKKCAYYHIKIQEEKKSGKNLYWSTIYEDEKVLDFLVKSNNEYALIKPELDPKNFAINFTTKDSIAMSTPKNSKEEIQAFLEQYNTKAQGIIGMGLKIKATEVIITKGDKIAVAGVTNLETLENSIPDYSYSKVFSLQSNEKHQLILFEQSE